MEAFNDENMDIFDKISFSKVEEEFYNMAITDMIGGASISDLEEVLKSYEDMEWYSACSGIKKALDDVKLLSNLLESQEIDIIN